MGLPDILWGSGDVVAVVQLQFSWDVRTKVKVVHNNVF